jgi:hypothetical protein
MNVYLYFCFSYPACKFHLSLSCINVSCCLSGRNIFLYVITYTARFSKKNIEHTVCVWISIQHLSETFLIMREIHHDIILNVHTV